MNNRTLGIRKFDRILMASAIEMIVGIVIELIDSAVTGHIVGMAGLSAMNVVAPVLGFTIFTENLFSVGTSMLYAKRTGEYRKKASEQIFGMGLSLSSLVGVMTFAVITLLLPLYLDAIGVHGRVREYVMIYMSFLRFELMLSPVYEVLNLLITTDGDEFLSMASNIARPLLNIALSIWLGRRYGIAGIGMGTLISAVVALAILMLHFFSQRSSLRPRRYFSWKDLRSMLLFGWNDSAMFFVLPALFFVITKLVILRFGETWLPVLTVLYAVIEITSVFESTGEAMRAILPIYMGDQNNRAVLRLTKHSRRVNQIFGVLFGVVLLVAADWIPLAFDIEEPYLLAVCARGLRIFAIACPTLSEMALVNSFYLNTGKPKIAMLETLLAQLVCPLVLVVPMILLFGMDGIFIGFAASAYLALLILGVVLYTRFGRESFPYYLKDNGCPILDEEVALDEADVMAFVGRVDGFLSAHGMAKKTALRVELACEEYLLLIRDQNKDEKVEAECCVRVEPGDVVLSIWDSGEVFDMTDEDAFPGSMRGFVVASLMVRQTGKKHMIATSFNRNCFRFPIGP
ncbi:MAG: hypothetical protein IJ119_10460 [Clostridia bacterium]|nr:hypothetical protein [Clostridia bacterium]